jgi:hypothetical protein
MFTGDCGKGGPFVGGGSSWATAAAGARIDVATTSRRIHLIIAVLPKGRGADIRSR